jgi:hypothetical protein
MGDNQYRIDDTHNGEIARLDGELMEALEGHNQPEFQSALAQLVAFVQQHGQMVPDDELVPSDVMVPAADMTLDEAHQALQTAPGGA